MITVKKQPNTPKEIERKLNTISGTLVCRSCGKVIVADAEEWGKDTINFYINTRVSNHQCNVKD